MELVYVIHMVGELMLIYMDMYYLDIAHFVLFHMYSGYLMISVMGTVMMRSSRVYTSTVPPHSAYRHAQKQKSCIIHFSLLMFICNYMYMYVYTCTCTWLCEIVRVNLNKWYFGPVD